MKTVKQVLCILLVSVILLTDFIGSIFAGGVAPDRRIAVRHLFIENTESGIEMRAAESFKILGFGEQMYIKNLEDCSYVGSPIRENTIPTAADGLINPNDPIKLYAFKDKVTFGFSVDGSVDWDEDFLVRVFDDSGKLLGSVSGSEVSDFHDEKGVDVYPSRNAKNYYVEFSYDQALRKRLYGNLNMRPNAAFGLSIGLPIPHIPSPRITIPDGSKKSSKSSKSSSKSSSSSRKTSKSKAEAENRVYCYVMFSVSTFEPDLLPEEVKEVESIVQQGKKEYNKSTHQELSDEEFYNSQMAVDELRGYFMKNRIQINSIRELRFSFNYISKSDINKLSNNYLTKNKISNLDSMTDAQVIALSASMIEGRGVGDPEYLRVVRDYKNKHGIKSYENMTINQLNRMRRAIQTSPIIQKRMEQYQKQQTQQKSSSSKAKSMKKKKSR